jgi:hypothetical protein
MKYFIFLRSISINRYLICISYIVPTKCFSFSIIFGAYILFGLSNFSLSRWGFFLSKFCVYLSKCIPDMFTRGLIMLGPSLFKHFFDQLSCVLRNPNQSLSDVIHCDTIVGRVDSQMLKLKHLVGTLFWSYGVEAYLLSHIYMCIMCYFYQVWVCNIYITLLAKRFSPNIPVCHSSNSNVMLQTVLIGIC